MDAPFQRWLCTTGCGFTAPLGRNIQYKPFDDPVFMDLLELVVRKLEVNALEIDREFIHELDALYLFLDEQLDIGKLQKRLTGENRA